MNDLKQKAIDDVINALGTSKAFSQQNKRAFAENIINEVPMSYWVGSKRAGQSEYFRKFRGLLKKAETAMGHLYNKIEEGLDGPYIDAQAQAEIHKRLGGHANRHIFLDYIEGLEKIADGQQLSKRKPGPNNLAPRLVARMIAIQYYKQFESFPAFTGHELRGVGKRDDGKDVPKQTPYGRVCSVVGKFFQIKISLHTQQDAVLFVKKENNS